MYILWLEISHDETLSKWCCSISMYKRRKLESLIEANVGKSWPLMNHPTASVKMLNYEFIHKLSI